MNLKPFVTLLVKIRLLDENGQEISLKKSRKTELFVVNNDSNIQYPVDSFYFEQLGDHEASISIRVPALNAGSYELIGTSVDYHWRKVDIGSYDKVEFTVAQNATETFIEYPHVRCRITPNEVPDHNSPFIGENGYWYVWNTESNIYENTGVKATPDINSHYISAVTMNSTRYEGVNHEVDLGNVCTRIKANSKVYNADNEGLIDLGNIGGGDTPTPQPINLDIVDFERESDLAVADHSKLYRYVEDRKTIEREGVGYGYGSLWAYSEDSDEFEPVAGLTITPTHSMTGQVSSNEEYERILEIPYDVSLILEVEHQANGNSTVDQLLIGSYLNPTCVSTTLDCFAMERGSYGRNYLVVKKGYVETLKKYLKFKMSYFSSSAKHIWDLRWCQNEAVVGVVVAGDCTAERIKNLEQQLGDNEYDFVVEDNKYIFDLGDLGRTSLYYAFTTDQHIPEINARISKDYALVINIDNKTDKMIEKNSLKIVNSEYSGDTQYCLMTQIPAKKHYSAVLEWNDTLGGWIVMQSDESPIKPTPAQTLSTVKRGNDHVVNVDGTSVDIKALFPEWNATINVNGSSSTSSAPNCTTFEIGEGTIAYIAEDNSGTVLITRGMGTSASLEYLTVQPISTTSLIRPIYAKSNNKSLIYFGTTKSSTVYRIKVVTGKVIVKNGNTYYTIFPESSETRNASLDSLPFDNNYTFAVCGRHSQHAYMLSQIGNNPVTPTKVEMNKYSMFVIQVTQSLVVDLSNAPINTTDMTAERYFLISNRSLMTPMTVTFKCKETVVKQVTLGGGCETRVRLVWDSNDSLFGTDISWRLE